MTYGDSGTDFTQQNRLILKLRGLSFSSAVRACLQLVETLTVTSFTSLYAESKSRKPVAKIDGIVPMAASNKS